MSKFDDLTNAVLDLKDQKKTLYRERESTCDRQRSKELEVELAAAPLSLVLRLAGIHHEAYTMPWRKGGEICILSWTE